MASLVWVVSSCGVSSMVSGVVHSVSVVVIAGVWLSSSRKSFCMKIGLSLSASAFRSALFISLSGSSVVHSEQRYS